jgi:hypothetical protein
MEDFTIDPEIQRLLPALSQEELDSLEASILDGMHVDPGVVAVLDSKRILADGHNRHVVCRKHGIPFPTRTKKFASRAVLIEWVIRNQLGRRSLTDEMRSYYRGSEYLAKRQVPEDATRSQGAKFAPRQNPGKTAEKVAEAHGVSPRTIHDDAKFAEAIDALPPNERHAVLDGTSGQTKAQTISGEKPILCARCRRVGAVKNCQQCTELRAENARPKAEPKKRKPGSVVFDDKPFDSLCRNLLRFFDDRKRALGDHINHVKIMDKLQEVIQLYKEWKT